MIPDLQAIEAPAFNRWFGSSKVVDGGGEPMVMYHGSREDFTVFDPEKTVDGGFHFGTEAQAKMRNSKNRMAVYLDIRQPKRVKDTGGDWKKKIAAAKRAGYDGIVYLNRFEGMTTERIKELSESGMLSRLDGLSDREFRRLVPEAEDSFIAFYPEQIKSATDNTGEFDYRNPDI